MEKVKKRSPNYTEDEKQSLLALVAKHKEIIESKQTTSYNIQKKNEAWTTITKEYNRICKTGPREISMLKQFYNNIKHRAKKNPTTENKQKYLINQLTPATISDNFEPTGEDDIQNYQIDLPGLTHACDNKGGNGSLIEVQDVKKKLIDEQKNIKTSDGGLVTLTLTDHQVSSLLDQSIRPDANSYDEAAEYSDETMIEEFVEESEPEQLEEENIHIKTLPRFRKRKSSIPKTGYLKKSAELLKKIYFKKKIELVYYEKKNEVQKFRNEQRRHELELKKYELEIKILKKQLEKAEKNM